MRGVLVPDLVVLLPVEGGVQLAFWAETAETKFLARINNINTVFLPTGAEREIGGKFLGEFSGFPMDSAVARSTGLSDCPVVDLIGAFSRFAGSD